MACHSLRFLFKEGYVLAISENDVIATDFDKNWSVIGLEYNEATRSDKTRTFYEKIRQGSKKSLGSLGV